MVVGFLDLQIMVGLVGKPEVKAVADAAEPRCAAPAPAWAAARPGRPDRAGSGHLQPPDHVLRGLTGTPSCTVAGG